ncbi:zinc finger, MYND-type containing 12 [Strigomonas culicis]|uniref:Zinc finger, MYND-type containing 12 n=1 Tax=Strigomonas culicis TaxID=28005 RepID=S9UKK4_9TRYP|nr:zinc finger, MYND-type containing 12 [Strigomonas culicis]|eukprot:EPY31377.1 zinc finger, MYND-type containing 12 [Strigomonas culicis]
MDLVNTSSTMGANALQMRQSHQERVREIIHALLSRAEEECRQLLLAGNAVAAEEAGVKVLRLREEFHGKSSPALVPCYIHLARTKQFMERYGEAEDMLSLAHFIVLQHQDDVTIAVKAELHQSYGLLYAADDKLDAAVKQLTCATYYLSCLYGPRNVLTTFSYFDLGNVFASRSSMESAMSSYDTVKEIWYQHLTQVLEEVVHQRAMMEKLKKYDDDANLFKNGYESARAFGEDNLADVSKMLYGIFSIQKERYRVDHPSTVKAEFILGLFLLWVQQEAEAQLHLSEARVVSQHFYGPRHPVVQEIEQWCVAFNIDYESSTSVAPDNEATSPPE